MQAGCTPRPSNCTDSLGAVRVLLLYDLTPGAPRPCTSLSNACIHTRKSLTVCFLRRVNISFRRTAGFRARAAPGPLCRRRAPGPGGGPVRQGEPEHLGPGGPDLLEQGPGIVGQPVAGADFTDLRGDFGIPVGGKVR